MTAVLIGFEYQDLIGTVYDLYHAYKYLSALDFHITIITDIKEVKYNISQLHQDVDDSFYTFLNSSEVIRVDNAKELNESLKKVKIYGPLFFYFSGHGVEKGILCPNKTIYSFDLIREYVDIPLSFTVLDCCYANNLKLPYYYSRDRPRLIKEYKEAKISVNSLFLFTSSKEDEIAKSEEGGSYFTKHLFTLLYRCFQRLRKINVSSLIFELNRHALKYGVERYAAYCSLPSLHNLPLFLFGKKEIDKIGPFYILKL